MLVWEPLVFTFARAVSERRRILETSMFLHAEGLQGRLMSDSGRFQTFGIDLGLSSKYTALLNF